MLEHYYVKPSTIDRIRDSWLGSQIDSYAGWMEANGYSSRTVFRRLPRLFCFAEFAQKRGCTDVASALALVEDFVSQWLVQHGPEAKTSASLRKHAIDVGNATRQMLGLASGDPVRHNRHRRPFPLESEVPGFQEYLRNECGLMESTIAGYRHHLHEFGQYLRKAGITSLGDLSPALLASFVVECAPGMAPCTRRDLCCHLKVLLRFCHREGITDRDLRGAVGMPQVYRLADVPRSITWDEVRRTLEAVDRRTIRGRRDYAILLFLVTYGLRAHEVAKLTLEDIDWKRERFQVPERKAGHSTAYPLAGVVAEALIDYLKRGRPETEDRHLFFRVVAPRSPITPATVSSSVAFYLQKAEIKVRKGGSHTLRHTCVQRLIDAEFPLKTIGDYVGHRSPESTRIYTKVATRPSIPMRPGRAARRDYEYKRCGTANAFCGIEPKAGVHFTKVTPTRSSPEFADFILEIAEHYSTADTIHLIMDNLSTHTRKALVDRFGEEVGGWLWDRFTVHYTPKHGSWLNQAEIEIGIFSRQCLGRRRIGDISTLCRQAKAWNRRTNRDKITIRWRFTRKHARLKLNYSIMRSRY